MAVSASAWCSRPQRQLSGRGSYRRLGGDRAGVASTFCGSTLGASCPTRLATTAQSRSDRTHRSPARGRAGSRGRSNGSGTPMRSASRCSASVSERRRSRSRSVARSGSFRLPSSPGSSWTRPTRTSSRGPVARAARGRDHPAAALLRAGSQRVRPPGVHDRLSSGSPVPPRGHRRAARPMDCRPARAARARRRRAARHRARVAPRGRGCRAPLVRCVRGARARRAESHPREDQHRVEMSAHDAVSTAGCLLPRPPPQTSTMPGARRGFGHPRASAVSREVEAWRSRPTGRCAASPAANALLTLRVPSIRSTRAHRGRETAERYQELADAVDAHCPVLDLFTNPTPVERRIAVPA